jgi:hypothetical protein
MKCDQTGMIPDSYTDTIIDSCPVAQLTWVPALDAAPRPVTEKERKGRRIRRKRRE